MDVQEMKNMYPCVINTQKRTVNKCGRVDHLSIMRACILRKTCQHTLAHVTMMLLRVLMLATPLSPPISPKCARLTVPLLLQRVGSLERGVAVRAVEKNADFILLEADTETGGGHGSLGWADASCVVPVSFPAFYEFGSELPDAVRANVESRSTVGPLSPSPALPAHSIGSFTPYLDFDVDVYIVGVWVQKD